MPPRLKPVELTNTNPTLRVFSRQPSPMETAPSTTRTTTSATTSNSHVNDSSETAEMQPMLQRKRSQHAEKGEFYRCDYRCETLTVFVIGASGDLARKKTYPSLYALYLSHYLPDEFTVVGYARSTKSDAAFRDTLRPFLLKTHAATVPSANREHRGDGSSSHGSATAPTDTDANADADAAMRSVDAFLHRCVYRYGKSYDDAVAIAAMADEMTTREQEMQTESMVANRLFYFAIPPAVFVPIARALKQYATGVHTGWSRFILEKPFGYDSESFDTLNAAISGLLREREVFRIDHYIGKEAVQNLLVMRFANTIFEPLWNRQFVQTVTISFKEDFGTRGRGGYFDKSGIVRDVMQNHLLQVLTMFAMDMPVRNGGDFIRDEKVKVLRAMSPVDVTDCITGQYVADAEGRESDYTSDEGVADDSQTPTFAAFVMYVDNARWEGVPFILRAGKALNERKSEIRIQFKKAAGGKLLFPGVGLEQHGLERNEMVMRLQPDEAVYLKLNIKQPGLAGDPVLSELDLSYRTRYPDKFSRLPDAYTRLLLQVLRGDASAFVRQDELQEAWRIFTPLLHAIDRGEVPPVKYEAFSRGPAEFDELARRVGYVYAGDAYQWSGEENGKTA